MNCARQVRARIQRLRAASSVDCTRNDASTTRLSSRIDDSRDAPLRRRRRDPQQPAAGPRLSRRGRVRGPVRPARLGRLVAQRASSTSIISTARRTRCSGSCRAAPPCCSAVLRASPSRSARATCSSYRPAPATAGSPPAPTCSSRAPIRAASTGTCAAAIPPSTTRCSPTSPPSRCPTPIRVLGADGPLIELWHGPAGLSAEGAPARAPLRCVAEAAPYERVTRSQLPADVVLLCLP